MSNQWTSNNENDTEITELPKFDFMREQIKERPINKKKLLRRTIITASMAVVFGLVACLTVLVLEPVINNWLYPEEKPEQVVLPQETEEMLPEDMVLDDTQLQQEEEPEHPIEIQTKEEDGLVSQKKIYDRMREVSKEASRALVTVTGVSSDKDWFDNQYESEGQSAGVIVADNGLEYLILTDMDILKEAQSIEVTFCDNKKVEAQVKMTDPIIGVSVLSIDRELIEASTLEEIRMGNFGSSNYASLVGSPVIALGSPMGIKDSVVYGMVTSKGNPLNLVDSQYYLMTTDIYGSPKATGVLINMQGQIVGIINQQYNDISLENMISALGISELKKTIERLSNGEGQAYLGIYGANVTPEVNERMQVPFGVYITEVEMDSPAMHAGIQSGDVLIRLDRKEISSYEEYLSVLSECVPESTIDVTVFRKNQEEYKEMSFQLTPKELK